MGNTTGIVSIWQDGMIVESGDMCVNIHTPCTTVCGIFALVIVITIRELFFF